MSESSAGRKILLADYNGYAFTLDLAGDLAANGFDVLYTTKEGVGGPNVNSLVNKTSSGEVRIEVQKGEPVDRSSYMSRFRSALAFGAWHRGLVDRFGADVIMFANTPPEAILTFALARPKPIPCVWWVQDLFGEAAEALLSQRSRALGFLGGSMYRGLEQRVASLSDAIVVISEDFSPHIPRAHRDKIFVIPNWAPVAGLPLSTKTTTWAKRHGLSRSFNFMYTGTLGKKHDPSVLLSLASRFSDCDDVKVVVVSEGEAVTYVEENAERRGLKNVLTLPFQQHEVLPQVMGAADVLVALLEPEAGRFSVPSKVLAYMCAGRPILAHMPVMNAASRLVSKIGAGVVVPVGDRSAFAEAGMTLYADDRLRAEMGAFGRAYAEVEFCAEYVGQRFRDVLSSV